MNDSSTLKSRFDGLVNAEALRPESEISGTKVSLDRRVSTRWNSELGCIDAHLSLYSVVQQLTGIRELKLQSFILTEEQFLLTKDLREVLIVSNKSCCAVSKMLIKFNVDFRRADKDFFTCRGASYCRCHSYDV